MGLALTQKVIFTMRDVGGKLGTTSLRCDMSGGTDPISTLTAYVSLLNGVSNCKVISEVGQTANQEDIGESEDNNYDARDKLAIEYVDSQNGHHVMHVADPDPSIFDSTNFEIVDPTDALWLAAVSAIEGNVVGKDGLGVTVIRGYRDRSRNLKTTMKYAP